MNTIIEKIRAEVERLKKANAKLGHTNDIERYEESAYDNACNTMLSILSDLEKEEKPMELDFERELYKHFGMVKDFTLGLQIAKHFHELGCRRTAEKYDEIEYKRQRAEESVPEDLEEAAVLWYKKCPFPKLTWWDEGEEKKLTDSRETFIAGAKWQKEQMMKEARPRFIHNVLDDNTIRKMVHLYSEEIPKEKNVVKLIIIKED